MARRTLVMRNVREVVDAARGKPILYFPARHDHWLVQTGDGWAAHVAGAIGVSTDAQASWWGGRGVGTVPHGLIAAYGGDTVAAARAFADALRRRDERHRARRLRRTTRCATALEVAEALGRRPVGRAARHLRPARRPRAAAPRTATSAPKGVDAELVQLVRDELDEHGFRDVRIVVSGGFNADRIRAFEAARVPVDAYGVGSSLIRGSNDFTADVVIVDGRPCAKVGRECAPEPAPQPGPLTSGTKRTRSSARGCTAGRARGAAARAAGRRRRPGRRAGRPAASCSAQRGRHPAHRGGDVDRRRRAPPPGSPSAPSPTSSVTLSTPGRARAPRRRAATARGAARRSTRARRAARGRPRGSRSRCRRRARARRRTARAARTCARPRAAGRSSGRSRSAARRSPTPRRAARGGTKRSRGTSRIARQHPLVGDVGPQPLEQPVARVVARRAAYATVAPAAASSVEGALGVAGLDVDAAHGGGSTVRRSPPAARRARCSCTQ